MKIACFQFSLFGINTYALFDPHTKECVIVDPGMINSEERNAMADFIRTNDLHVTQIINTHLHIDHVVGNQWLKQTYGAPVAAHDGDARLGDKIQHQAVAFGIPVDIDKISADVILKPGDKIKVGEDSLEVIHVPGHSKGSIALYAAEDGFLISGDALFAGSIGRTDLPGGSLEELLESIKTGLLTLPEETVVYPGHGPATTIGREKRSNPYLR